MQRITPPGGLMPGLVTIALVAVLAAFGLGYRWGAEPGHASPPTDLAARPTIASSVGSALPATPGPQRQTAVVAAELQWAYLRQSAAAAICSLDGSPTCSAIGDFFEHGVDAPERVDAPDPGVNQWLLFQDCGSDGVARLADLGSVTAVPAHLVLAANLRAYSVNACIEAVDEGMSQLWTQTLPAVDPGGLGIRYLDLGTLGPGRYVVKVNAFRVATLGCRWSTYRELVTVASHP